MLKVSTRSIEEFQKKHPKESSRVLRYLYQNLDFYQAFEYGEGQAILKEHAKNMDGLLEKIYNEEATDMELAEFRVLKEITLRIAKKLINYKSHLKRVGG